MSMSGEGRWIHPLCRPLLIDTNGPFVVMPDDYILTVDEQGAHLSADDGAKWMALTPRAPRSGQRCGIVPARKYSIRRHRHALSGYGGLYLHLG